MVPRRKIGIYLTGKSYEVMRNIDKCGTIIPNYFLSLTSVNCHVLHIYS